MEARRSSSAAMAGEKEGSLGGSVGRGGEEKVCCSAEMRAWAAERAWGVGSVSMSVNRKQEVSFCFVSWKFFLGDLGGGKRTWEGFVVRWEGHCCCLFIYLFIYFLCF